MAMSQAQYATFMENTEQVITARNQEEYLALYPGAFPAPDPTYAEWLPTGHDQMVECMGAGNVHAAVLTTGSSGGGLGKATLTYPTMVTPVAVATVLDATQDNTYFQTCVESVSATQVVVRVTSASGLTLLGIPLLSQPSLAAGATVYVMVYDAG